MGRSGQGLVKERFGRGPRPDFSCVILSRAIACPSKIAVSNPTWISRRAWLAIPLVALGFLVATTARRVLRIEHMEDAGSPAPAASAAPKAPWQPRLVIPGHHNESYEWLDQTYQMFSKREWRVRSVDYENAPGGHEVLSASPYRWWLGLVAYLHSGFTPVPLRPSVEWAAIYADPILLMLFGVITTLFVAWRYGAFAAALLSAAAAALFPFAAEFLPGIPDDNGMALVLQVWSILALLAGAASAEPGRRSRWFAAAGILGGIGLWVSVPRELPILIGLGLAGIVAARLARGSTEVLPWRSWSQAGGATCLLAYVIEFFPSHMASWELRVIHPLFGIAWLGGGEIVARATELLQQGTKKAGWRAGSVWILSVAALASVPVALWIGKNLGFLSLDLPSMRLSLLPNGAAAPNLWAWLLQNGFTGPVWATLLPLLVLVPSLTLLFLPRLVPAALRIPVALALGPVLVAVLFGVRQISWWNQVDAAVLSLLVATAAASAALPRPRLVAGLAASCAALFLIPGAVQLWPAAKPDLSDGLSETEVVGLVERDMASWLAKHAGPAGAVVLAPPNATATLYYYGGMRGLASFGWDNSDGFQAAVRIVSANTPEEAQELIGIHGVTHIIIPVWDPFMDAYAQIGEGTVEGTFLARLHQWNLPPWLKPVPYLLPTIGGFEGQSVVILEVVDEQDDATSASRLVQYFIDMGQLDLAVKAGVRLRRFPADLGALLARTQLERATSDGGEYSDTVNLLIKRIALGADGTLPWDQRVNLSIVLAQTRHLDLARPRLRQCLDEADPDKLRSLSTNSLYRMQVLGKAFTMDFKDPAMAVEAANLLPEDLRGRIGE
jgi:hypothetical protein